MGGEAASDCRRFRALALSLVGVQFTCFQVRPLGLSNSSSLGSNCSLRVSCLFQRLTLIYSGIDILGNLGRPKGQERRGRHDFIAWADRYMVGPKQLQVTGLELYAARCGVLHNLGAESNLSNSRSVRPVLYAWGGRDATAANELLIRLSTIRPELAAVVVRIEDIANAFIEGIVAFGREIASDSDWEIEVTVRAYKIFSHYDQFPGAVKSQV